MSVAEEGFYVRQDIDDVDVHDLQWMFDRIALRQVLRHSVRPCNGRARRSVFACNPGGQ